MEDGLDAAIEAAVDGLRALASRAAEVVVAEHEGGDRAQLVAAAEIETVATSALGITGAGDELVLSEQASTFTSFLAALPRAFGLGKRSDDDAPKENEDAHDAALAAAVAAAQLAPITDIAIVHAGDPLPPGYTRVEWSATGLYPADLNAVRT